MSCTWLSITVPEDNYIIFSISHSNPMGLLAALDDNGMATGSLFWDDGTSIGIINILFCSTIIAVNSKYNSKYQLT